MKDLLPLAAEAIHQKKCVVFPTETVYGLGANALCTQSVVQIFQLKNRPPKNPLIVHVPSIEKFLSLTPRLLPLEIKLLEKFSPGPLSLIVPKKNAVPDIVTGGLDTVGIRIPNHPIALELLNLVGVPLAAPSANISGKPSPTTYEMAQFYMKDQNVLVLDGGTLDLGIESTVIKVENNQIYLLRAGAITPEMIAECTGIIPIGNIHEEQRSPGTRYAHYQPQARVILFEGSPPPNKNSAILYLNEPIDTSGFVLAYHFSTLEAYAKALYYTFFECDQKKIPTIYCELPSTQGQGLALRDRLFKAAGLQFTSTCGIIS